MKKFIFLWIIALFITGANGFGQVSINSSGAAPDSSAMLDLVSTTRGLLPPRMTSEQRNDIASPASGLVVYDTDSASYYIHNSSGWCELVMEDETGTTIIGSSTNNTTIENDGSIKYTGSATVWDDMMVFPDATGRTGSQIPLYDRFRRDPAGNSQGVFLWWFSASTEQELYFTLQFPHGYKVGSTVYPHLHWTTRVGTPTASNVVWGLEYSVIAIGGTFQTTTTITGNTVIAAIGTPTGTHQHLITSLGTIPGTGLGISTILVGRLYRAVTNGSDTFANEAGLLGFDIHYERDTEGSRQEYIK